MVEFPCSECGEVKKIAEHKLTRCERLNKPVRCSECVRKEAAKRCYQKIRDAMKNDPLHRKSKLKYQPTFAEAFKEKTGRELKSN